MIDKAVDLLGKKAKDKITGFSGIVTSVCFDLYGCIQIILAQQKTTKESSGWIDINRIIIVSHKRIMPLPTYNHYETYEDVHGPAEKPDK